MFDHPNPASLAAYLAAELSRQSGSQADAGTSSAVSANSVFSSSGGVSPAAAARPAMSQAELQQQLLDLVADTTGASVESVQQPLMEAGVDSIGSVELR